MNWNRIPERERQIINELLMNLRSHDEGTYFHCLRVSHLSQFVAEAAGFSTADQFEARLGGLLHDIGKAIIPVDVLNKPTRLNDDEFNKMKDHASASASMMEPLLTDPLFIRVQAAVRHHHERMDGKGYPSGLGGDSIPHLSRVILIADTVDAMTADRPYRKGLPIEVVYRELERFSGTQFDPELAQCFIRSHKNLNNITPTKDSVIEIFSHKKKAA